MYPNVRIFGAFGYNLNHSDYNGRSPLNFDTSIKTMNPQVTAKSVTILPSFLSSGSDIIKAPRIRPEKSGFSMAIITAQKKSRFLLMVAFSILLRLMETRCCRFPINGLKKGLNVVRFLYAVIKSIGVFKNVKNKERHGSS